MEKNISNVVYSNLRDRRFCLSKKEKEKKRETCNGTALKAPQMIQPVLPNENDKIQGFPSVRIVTQLESDS